MAAAKEMGKSGTVTLTAHGKTIGSGAIARTAPFRYSLSEGQDIGRDEGTPVDHSYRLPLRIGEIFGARPYLFYRESLARPIKKRQLIADFRRAKTINIFWVFQRSSWVLDDHRESPPPRKG